MPTEKNTDSQKELNSQPTNETIQDDERNKSLLVEYKISIETRKLEIQLFWQRSLFFWGFNVAAFAAFAAFYGKHNGYTVLVAGFGVICSWVWTLANRGSKRWQENWEQKVKKLEEILKKDLFRSEEKIEYVGPKIYKPRNYSVTKLTMALSDFVFLFWTVVLIVSTFIYSFDGISRVAFLPWCIIFYTIVIFGYVLYIGLRTHSNKSTNQSGDSNDQSNHRQ